MKWMRDNPPTRRTAGIDSFHQGIRVYLQISAHSASTFARDLCRPSPPKPTEMTTIYFNLLSQHFQFNSQNQILDSRTE